MTSYRNVLLLVVSIICTILLISSSVYGNVIGLDFGSDSMKIAIVKPGSPIEIVSNFQSKRKTPTIISFYRGERLFGSDAYALMGRKPELTFTKFHRMIGRSPEHPLVQEVPKNQYFPYDIYTNETSRATLFKQEDTYYTPEELVAMMLQHAKDITAAHGGHAIKDCVITVPSSFTQQERRAMYAAADIADLRVLTLIEENTAAALHYGIDRVFEEPNTVLYYNMGSSHVQVSVVTYSSYLVKEAGKNKTIGNVEVVGKAWDSSLGGFNFDVKLAELLANRFNEAWGKKASGKGKDLKNYPRPMTRLRLEANKVKEVLSANGEYPVKSEQLHEEVDLITKVTRAEFEEACTDLFARLTAPIEKALAMANLTLDNVQAVELLGGGVRMPKVKKILDEYFKKGNEKVEVGQHLNGDEAMALGASFRAANLSTNFRVRKVGVSDISTFGVSVQLDSLPKEPTKGGFFGLLGSKKKEVDADTWHKETVLYPAKSQIPSKQKTLAFNYDSDILCKLEYTDEVTLPEGTSNVVAVYNITGIADFAKETASKGLGQPKVHLSFALDGNGIVTLSKAEATLELPAEKEEEEELKVEADTNSTDATSSDNSTESSTSSNSTEAEGEEKVDDKKKTKTPKKDKKSKKIKTDNVLRRNLGIVDNSPFILHPTYSTEQIIESRLKLKALKDADDRRKAKEAALNDLEGYIYKVKNRIMDDEDKLKKISTDEQRQEVMDVSNAAEEWLYEDQSTMTVADYKKKQKEISVKAEAIFLRFSELTARPKTVEKALATLANVTAKIETWNTTMPHITAAEIEKLTEIINKSQTWITENVEKQEKASLTEDPIFLSSDIAGQLKPVSIEFEKLMRKPKPVPPKVKTPSNKTSSSNSTKEEDETVRVNVNTTENASKTESEGEKKEEEEVKITTEESEGKSDL